MNKKLCYQIDFLDKLTLLSTFQYIIIGLKLSASRLDMESNKKTALMKQNMRSIAELLMDSPPREEKARLCAKALYRDYTIMAYEILKFECELLAERIKMIENSDECPLDLQSSISTLIYSAPRVSIPELTSVRKQFRRKYGRTFKRNAMANKDNILNEKVVTYLSDKPPAKDTVNLYLQKICKQYEIDWNPVIELSNVEVLHSPEIPVTTGLEKSRSNDDDIDGSNGDGSDDGDIKMFRGTRNLTSLEVLPPPPPNNPGCESEDTSSMTSDESLAATPVAKAEPLNGCISKGNYIALTPPVTTTSNNFTELKNSLAACY